MIGKAGPNCSSSTNRLPSVSPAMTVGLKKVPGPAKGPPPATATPPRAKASSTNSRTR